MFTTVEDILGRGYRRKKIFYKGEHKFLSDWCTELGLDYNKTNLRLHRGWSVDKAFGVKGGVLMADISEIRVERKFNLG